MSTVKVSKSRKMTLLGGLYITQFLGLSFILTAVPTIMREAGAGLDDIAWIYMLGLVWAVKFLWSPLVDRFGSKRHGHYRSWLISLQSLLMLSIVAAALFDINTQMPILAVFFMAISLFSATQDIAADALAITILEPRERGWGNSIQAAGGFIGNIIGGGVVLIAYAWLGWTASLLILAAGTALPLMNVWRHKEQPAPADGRPEKVSYKDLYRFFRRPNTSYWLVILLFFGVSVSISYGLINPMLVDIGWSLNQIGFATNILGSLASVVGAIIAGVIVQRVGRKSAMLSASIFTALSLFGLFLPAQGVSSNLAIYSSIILMMLAYGATSTVLYTMMMDKSNPETAGTDYSLQYALYSFFSFVMAGVALAFAESFGYSVILIAAIAVGVFSLVLLLFYKGFEPTDFERSVQSTEPQLAGAAD
ncbi:MAG: MFS transporter [Deinococcota bacterium]